MRQRIDGELEQLRSSVHRILSEQQQEFAQAFGLHDEHSSSEVSHILIRIHPDESVPITLHFPVIHPASRVSFISFCFVFYYTGMYRTKTLCLQVAETTLVPFFTLLRRFFSTI